MDDAQNRKFFRTDLVISFYAALSILPVCNTHISASSEALPQSAPGTMATRTKAKATNGRSMSLSKGAEGSHRGSSLSLSDRPKSKRSKVNAFLTFLRIKKKKKKKVRPSECKFLFKIGCCLRTRVLIG